MNPWYQAYIAAMQSLIFRNINPWSPDANAFRVIGDLAEQFADDALKRYEPRYHEIFPEEPK